MSLSSWRLKQVLFQSKLPQIIHVTMAHSIRCFRNRAAFLQLQFFTTPSQYRLFTISVLTTEPMNKLPKYLHLSLGLHLLSWAVWMECEVRQKEHKETSTPWCWWQWEWSEHLLPVGTKSQCGLLPFAQFLFHLHLLTMNKQDWQP